MSRWQIRLFFWLLVLSIFGLSSCSTPSATQREQQTIDGLTIAIEWTESPRLNQNQSFLITLTDAQNRPVEDAEIYLDLDMPTMPMGKNQPIADPVGNGTYQAAGVYTMTGDWEITVVATVQGKEYRAIFTTQVRD